MRLVKVSAPEGKAPDVARVAFGAGIEQVVIRQEQILKADQSRETKDVVDLAVSTAIVAPRKRPLKTAGSWII